MNYSFICKISVSGATLSGNALVASNVHISTPLFCPFWKRQREILTGTRVGLIEKELLWFVCGIGFILKLIEYTNDHSPDVSTIPTRIKFNNWSYSQFSLEKLHWWHSIITLSQNGQTLDPASHLVRTCLILVTPSPFAECSKAGKSCDFNVS